MGPDANAASSPSGPVVVDGTGAVHDQSTHPESDPTATARAIPEEALPLAAAPPVADQNRSLLDSYYGGKPPVALSAERTSDGRDLRSAAMWRPSSPEDVPLPPPSRADQLPRDNSGALMTIAVGAAIAIGAGLISLVSYQDAEGGGTYVVLWGAVVAGVMISLHGLRDLLA